MTAAGLVVAAVAAGGAFAWRWADAEATHREHAWSIYSQIVDHEDSGAFRLRREKGGLLKLRGDQAEAAKRHLDRYGILESKNWRLKDDFRSLPETERGELEVWLLEQALRFAQARGMRPDSEADWRLALVCLENAAPYATFGPIEAQARVLRRLLRLADPPSRTQGRSGQDPLGADDYLAGVEGELRGDLGGALDHYLAVLHEHPGFFWANYRAAAVEYARRDYRAAADHLLVCVDRRPANAVLRLQYAGCLTSLGQLARASEQYVRAEALNPDQGETYLSRAFLDVRMGQPQNFLRDITRYEVLKGLRATSRTNPLSLDPARGLDGVVPEIARRGWAREDDPDLTSARRGLATELMNEGRDDLALDQFEQVLTIEPGDIKSLYARAVLLSRLNLAGADREFARVVQHPEAESWVRAYPFAIFAFLQTADSLIEHGQPEDAVSTAKEGVRLASRFHEFEGKAHFTLARAYAHAARNDASLARLAAEEFGKARSLSPGEIESWKAETPGFGDSQAMVDRSPPAP